jgi:Fe-S cluster assembly ATPase SufC
MAHGQIITTGDQSLAQQLEERGYDWLLAAHALEVAAS